jgi:hypothetical protein
MSQTAKISFSIDTTDIQAQLGFEAWIDDHKFYDTDHVTGPEHLETAVSDDDAQHQLRFILKNKTVDHTKLDQAGNIIADARLLINNITFDEIQLGYMIVEQTTYEHDFNGTGQTVQEKFYGEMGCNGTVSLRFTSPIYLWLLEHM